MARVIARAPLSNSLSNSHLSRSASFTNDLPQRIESELGAGG